MPTLFPEDYEKAVIAKKRKLTKFFKEGSEVTALAIALHAHEIYDYLRQQGVEKPNRLFVEAFQYASTTLDVPYDVIDEAFLTQTKLTEKTLFDVSKKFNPKATLPPVKELPLVPITIDFYKIVVALFEKLPASFWEQFRKKDNVLSKNIKQLYDLETLLQSFLQEVWSKTKAEIEAKKEPTLEEARQMFLAYFYRNDQKYYRKETQEMLLNCFNKCLEAHSTKNVHLDETLKRLLEESDSEGIAAYVVDHLDDWTEQENYKRFLRSISKTKNLSLMNQLLLLYQRSEAAETKEVHDWIREVRSLKEGATPIFLFGENAHKVNGDTGEIIEEKRLSLTDHEQLPIIPYFEKSDTEGRGTRNKNETSPTQLFLIFEKMSKQEIIFDRVEKSTVDAYKIRLKADQSEQQTLQDLLVCLIEKEEPERDKIIRFENQSVASVLCMVFGLDPLPLDFEVLDNLRSLENGKVKIQRVLTKVIFRSEQFLQRVETHLNEKKPIKIRATLEEEIKQARELQSQAMANISTSKENKAEKKSDTPFSMSDYLEKFKDGTEGNNDDGSNKKAAT
ncbi:hypothetical protein [Candidatus Enterococcus ikei]|uniref:Uncharacterized protein n=1 Tax=Candidatus Enterococcus ikei TaxID=2815326 RepID=A0ABS3H4C5_9ENTE|nr:hypothetical protein [Enterococcus sp. DIV0869a]MBO0441549.1 hypothetical protein [Enterococcus sp. DIV0869a]